VCGVCVSWVGVCLMVLSVVDGLLVFNAVMRDGGLLIFYMLGGDVLLCGGWYGRRSSSYESCVCASSFIDVGR
jgi:hypothetical protein